MLTNIALFLEQEQKNKNILYLSDCVGFVSGLDCGALNPLLFVHRLVAVKLRKSLTINTENKKKLCLNPFILTIYLV